MKACRHCESELSSDNFYKNKNNADGLDHRCKPCAKLYSSENYNRKSSPTRARSIYSGTKRERNAQAVKKYRMNNQVARIKHNLRTRVRMAIKDKKKAGTTADLVGCEIDFLIDHIESLFADWMSWENYGEWHIDHIKPCAAFDLNDPAQQIECFNYRNLQPLSAVDNLRKKDKYPSEIQGR